MDPHQRLPGRCRLLAATLLVVLPGCGPEEPEIPSPPPSGAVSTATPEATQAAIHVLGLGGNAVDAAVAASLALGVSEPSESGLGGSAVMLIVPPGSEATVVHSPPEAVATPAGTFLRPSALAVLVHAWRRYGSGAVPWERIVEPALRLAEDGYRLGRFRHRMMVREYRRIDADEVAAALLLNEDRSLPSEGTRVRFPALAATLERLAGTAPDELPLGEYANGVAGDLAELVGADAARRLATPATPIEEPPLAGTYRGWSVLVPGSPYGGPRVLRALELLASAPVAALRGSGEVRTAWIAEALGYAMADPGTGMAAWLTDTPPLPIPEPAGEPVGRTLRAAAPPSDGARPTAEPAADSTPPAAGARPPAPDSAGGGDETSHLSIVDGRGMAVSLTLSLGGPFGARATRLGFFLGRPPEPRPVPDTGAAGDTTAAPADTAATVTLSADPWEEPASWSVPTVLLRDGRPGLVLGSPGGPRAISAVVQAISDWVDGGLELEQVVSAARLHVEPDGGPRPRIVLEGVVWLDPGEGATTALAPWGDSVRVLAANRGFTLGEWDTGMQQFGLSPFFGGVNAVARGEEGWIAAADPRRDGVGRLLDGSDVLRALSDDPFEGPEDTLPLFPPPSRGSSPGDEPR